jgi:hypothetical protein
MRLPLRAVLSLLPNRFGRGRVAAGCFLGTALIILLFSLLVPKSNGFDFLSYWNAGHDLLAGHSPYRADVLGPLVSAKGAGPFRYPPPFALIGVPFALLEQAIGTKLGLAISVMLWQILSLGAWGLACRWIWRRSVGGLPIGAPALTLLIFGPWDGLLEGNVSWLLAALVVGLLAALESRRTFWAGTAVALGALIKLEPALFGVLLAGRRQWRTLAWALMVGGLICLVTFVVPGVRAGWADYPQVLSGLLAMDTNYAGNLAPINQLLRLGFVPANLEIPLERLLLGIVLIVAYLAGRRWNLRAGWALTSLLMLFGAAVVWPHYPAVLLGPALLFLGRQRPRRARRWLWAWAWATLSALLFPALFWLVILPLWAAIWVSRRPGDLGVPAAPPGLVPQHGVVPDLMPPAPVAS